MNWGSEELIQNYFDFESNLTRAKDVTSIADQLKHGDKFLKDLRKEMGFNDSNRINIVSIILNAEGREELREK